MRRLFIQLSALHKTNGNKKKGVNSKGLVKNRLLQKGSGVSVLAGFSLLEVLVAVAIMSIGLLGLTSLQLVSMQHNRDALYRARAQLLAEDMLERIRANPTAAYASQTPSGNSTDCTARTCRPAELAAYDLAQWHCGINSAGMGASCDSTGPGVAVSLPNAEGSISLDNGIYIVKVQWQAGSTGELSSTSLSTQIASTP